MTERRRNIPGEVTRATTADQNLARRLRALAALIDDQGPRARRNAWDWRGHIRAANTDPTGGGPTIRVDGEDVPVTPTEAAALQAPHWTHGAWDELNRRTTQLDIAMQHAQIHVHRICGRADDKLEETRETLTRQNTREGCCHLCGRWCTGQGSDRLRVLRGTLNPTRADEIPPRYCPACSTDWYRAREADAEIDFDQWVEDRKSRVERTTEDR